MANEWDVVDFIDTSEPKNFSDIFAQAEQQYGLQSGLLSAIAKQENVNPAYNNPLGLSTDRGVMKFSEDEAQDRIFKQAALLKNPKGPYRDFARTGSIDDLAKVYSPVGAANDLRGTNATEAAGIKANLPTGKKVMVEPMYDLSGNITPIATLDTRRATPVHPEDAARFNWDTVIDPVDMTPTMEKQVVTAPEEADTSKPPSVFELAMTPAIPGEYMPPSLIAAGAEKILPKSLATDIYTGEMRGVGELMSGLTSPVGIATLGVGTMGGLATKLMAGAFSGWAAINAPDAYKRFNATTDPAEKTKIATETIGGIGLPLLAFLGGRGSPEAKNTPQLAAGVDEVIGRRVQKPWENVAVNDATGDFIDVPFVRVSDGTLGERVHQFLAPQEGQRPAQALLLMPGERTPGPLQGYPEIKHGDGSRTVFRPDETAEIGSDFPEIEFLDENEMFPTEFEEVPTPDELALPTMSGKQFESYLADLERQSQLDDAAIATGDFTERGFGDDTTPISKAIMGMGGIKSARGKRRGKAFKLETPGHNAMIFKPGGIEPDVMAQNLFDAGLIDDAYFETMRDALIGESKQAHGLFKKGKAKQPELPVPTQAQVLNDLEQFGLTDDERMVVAGNHYLAVDSVTGEIRDIFPTREDAMDYLQGDAQPGETILRRRPGQPDALVAKRPDTVATSEALEIEKAKAATGKEELSGTDWDEYLKLEEPQTDAELVASQKAEAQGNLAVQTAAEKKAKVKYGWQQRLVGGEGDIAQTELAGAEKPQAELFAQKPKADTAKLERDISNLEYRMQQDKRRSVKRPEDVARLAELKASKSELALPPYDERVADRIASLYTPEEQLNEMKRLGIPSKNAQKVWDKARYRDIHDTETDWGANFQDAVNDDLSAWQKAMKAKMKGKGESGAILDPFASLRKKLQRSKALRAFRDFALSKEGAVRNLSSVFARERGNIIRQDFGLVKDAIRKGTKPYRDLEALSAIEESGRNLNTLRDHRNLVATSKSTKMRDKWLPVYDYALREFNRINAIPDKFRDEMMRQISWEAYRGVDMGFTPNYVPHLFADAPKGFMFGGFFKGAGGNALPRWFTKTRAFNSLAEAIHEGENPRSMNAADIAEARIRAGKRLVLGKDYQAALKAHPMPDGKPALSATDQRGYVPIDVYGTKVWAHPDAANFLDVLFDTSAIRKSGVGRVALGTAGVQKQLQLMADTFHAVRLSAYLAGAGKGITRLPRAGYRRGLATLELSPEQYAKAIASGEYSPAEVRYARENRPLMIELLGQGAEVSKWADNLSQQMHALVPGTKRLNSFIFDSLGRGALQTALLENFKRYLKRYPELSREQAARKTVIEMNEMFGNPGRKIFKNKTFQDIMQMLMLAPNWVLTQALNEGRAYAQMAGYPVNVIQGLAKGQGVKSFTRLGATAQSRLALTAGLFVLGQVLNMAFNNGKSTFDNDEGHTLHTKIPKGTLGTEKDYYFDPAQIPFEFTHQIVKYMRKGETLFGKNNALWHIAENKLSKIARTAGGIKQYATEGKVQTYRGGPTATTGPDAARLLAAEMLPLPIFSGGVLEAEPRSNWLFRGTRRPDAAMLQAAASAGVKLEPEETARQTMYVKAKPFMRAEDQAAPMVGKYSQLKHALENRDRDSVANEMALIMKEAPTRAERVKMFDNIHKSLGIGKDNVANQTYFTHSKEHEAKFLRSLKPEERSQYRDAQREHRDMVRFYLIMEPRLKRQLIFGGR